MYKNISYGNKKLEDLIRKKHLIPYSLNRRDRYERGKYYYSEFLGLTFKVLFVKYYESGELEGAEVKYENGLRAYICTDIDPGYDYRVEKDTKELYKKDEIVNDGNIYTGAEIRYWFFMRGIDCFSGRYKGFWNSIDSFSTRRIVDSNRYTIVADPTFTGKYYNCRIIRAEKESSGE